MAEINNNESATLMIPDAVKLTLGDVEYSLVYDMNALCALEKLYPSVDVILQMILGHQEEPVVPDTTKVTYLGAHARAADILVDGTPLADFIVNTTAKKVLKHSDTLNLLWAGCLHDYTIFDARGEIIGYSLSKAKLGSFITFKNLRDVNAKIIMSLIRDLVPSEAVKNGDAPVPVVEEEQNKVTPLLVLRK